MTASSDLSVREQRIVEALRPFFGSDADALFEAHGRSLQLLAHFARQSALPACHRLATGLALAQELLVEELSTRSVFDSPKAVADFLKLHFAGQPHESFAVLYLDARHALIAFEDGLAGPARLQHRLGLGQLSFKTVACRAIDRQGGSHDTGSRRANGSTTNSSPSFM